MVSLFFFIDQNPRFRAVPTTKSWRCRKVNGFPIWRHAHPTEERWLFTSKTQQTWMIGSATEAAQDFASDTGFVTHGENHKGWMPNTVKKWYINGGGTLVRDTGITVGNGSEAPETFRLSMDDDVHECAGLFSVVQNRKVNGFPLWKHASLDFWMYTGVAEGAWMVGGQDEAEQNFACDDGFMTTGEKHEGIMPDAVPKWFIDPQKDDIDDWTHDPSILFRAVTSPAPPAPLLRFTVPQDLHACSGLYRLVENRTVQGYPYWNCEENERWIYTGIESGAWMLGGLEENAANFLVDDGFITNGEKHEGLMPHQWRTWYMDEDGHFATNDDWLLDPGITCVAENAGAAQQGTVSAARLSSGAKRKSSTPAWRPGAVVPPQLLRLTVPTDPKECGGLYRLVDNRKVNKCPYWKHNTLERWLYTGVEDRAWMVGGADEAAQDLNGCAPPTDPQYGTY